MFGIELSLTEFTNHLGTNNDFNTNSHKRKQNLKQKSNKEQSIRTELQIARKEVKNVFYRILKPKDKCSNNNKSFLNFTYLLNCN